MCTNMIGAPNNFLNSLCVSKPRFHDCIICTASNITHELSEANQLIVALFSYIVSVKVTYDVTVFKIICICHYV